jgi:beta-lactamase regulating signal transducer with metallopeptidase domain
MTNIKQVQEKKAKRRGVPVLGLILAVALMGVAYGISFPLVTFAEQQSDSVKTQFDDLRQEFASKPWYQDTENIHGNNIVEIITAIVLWFIMMGIAMLVVSAALVGTDEEREILRNMPPSPANKKEIVKQMKKDLKYAKQRAKEQERKRK